MPTSRAAAATKEGGASAAAKAAPTVIEANPHAWHRSACAAGIDQHPAAGKASMLARQPTVWRRRADPAADEEAKRLAERPDEVQASEVFFRGK